MRQSLRAGFVGLLCAGLGLGAAHAQSAVDAAGGVGASPPTGQDLEAPPPVAAPRDPVEQHANAAPLPPPHAAARAPTPQHVNAVPSTPAPRVTPPPIVPAALPPHPALEAQAAPPRHPAPSRTDEEYR